MSSGGHRPPTHPHLGSMSAGGPGGACSTIGFSRSKDRSAHLPLHQPLPKPAAIRGLALLLRMRLYARRVWKGRSIFNRATENGPAFWSVLCVQTRAKRSAGHLAPISPPAIGLRSRPVRPPCALPVRSLREAAAVPATSGCCLLVYAGESLSYMTNGAVWPLFHRCSTPDFARVGLCPQACGTGLSARRACTHQSQTNTQTPWL